MLEHVPQTYLNNADKVTKLRKETTACQVSSYLGSVWKPSGNKSTIQTT